MFSIAWITPKAARLLKDIHKDIVHQRAKPLGSGGHHAEHDITGLGYRRESEESLQILLAEGEEVTYGDGEDNQGVEHPLPGLAVERTEHLHHYHEERESGGSPWRLPTDTR